MMSMSFLGIDHCLDCREVAALVLCTEEAGMVDRWL